MPRWRCASGLELGIRHACKRRAKINDGGGTYYTANNSAVSDGHPIGRSAGDIDGLEPRAQHAVCHTAPRCLGIAGE